MGCRKMRSFTVCGTHLGFVTSEKQCTQLLQTANTWASRGPLIISGDMNLRWDNDDEQRKLKNCMRNVPGFTRKSDGNRQHVFTRNGGWGFLATGATGTVSMGPWSDHDAFWADLRP
ncbi:endonuclease/exonuclease/phosphatase family protein [Nonomuraea sp. NPDC050547]|uniref:endonuclease/exonuclease/phosphatase family protein n=1 Tax=unclassified Nonomuraea TaxID=2593643 RepID=UPI0037BC5DCE